MKPKKMARWLVGTMTFLFFLGSSFLIRASVQDGPGSHRWLEWLTATFDRHTRSLEAPLPATARAESRVVTGTEDEKICSEQDFKPLPLAEFDEEEWDEQMEESMEREELWDDELGELLLQEIEQKLGLDSVYVPQQKEVTPAEPLPQDFVSQVPTTRTRAS